MANLSHSSTSAEISTLAFDNNTFCIERRFFFSITCHKQFMSFAASETNILQRFILIDGSSGTWLEAQTYCKTNYTDLARVRNQQENEVLQTMLTENPVWFGLRMQSWVWSDGSQPSFQPWNYPVYFKNKGDCGALVFGHRFHGLIRMDCSNPASFFCYSGKNVVLSHSKCPSKITSPSKVQLKNTSKLCSAWNC